MKKMKCIKCGLDITNNGGLYIREDGKVIKVCKDCHQQHLKERATERAYKLAKARKIEEERDKKTAVSLIRELVIGDVAVSQLRMERDKARVMYRSVDEAINIKKLELRIVESQIGREWHA